MFVEIYSGIQFEQEIQLQKGQKKAGLSPAIVPRRRLELLCPNEHYPLKVACLPIPPPGQGSAKVQLCMLLQKILLKPVELPSRFTL